MAGARRPSLRRSLSVLCCTAAAATAAAAVRVTPSKHTLAPTPGRRGPAGRESTRLASGLPAQGLAPIKRLTQQKAA